MSARFPQAAIVGALFVELQRATDAVSARSLADAIAPRFPGVPHVLLRTLAGQLLRLAFEPDAFTGDDIERAADSRKEAADACRWLAGWLASEADELAPGAVQ